MNSPVIGITLDSESPGGYSSYPWYALRQNYGAVIARLGGAPVMLPHHAERVGEYITLIDGLIVTGGAFDIDPTMYGDKGKHSGMTLKSVRTAFEWAITEAALKAGKPILGICGGEQLLNVILGGTLIQHIPDEVEEALEHEQKNPKHEPGHEVEIIEGTLLHEIIGVSKIQTNTTHHQAVKKPAPGVVVNAKTKDGVIEGIEYPEHPFCLGLQWHPEYEVGDHDTKIFQAFLKACAR